jgi:hypothetical protein
MDSLAPHDRMFPVPFEAWQAEVDVRMVVVSLRRGWAVCLGQRLRHVQLARLDLLLNLGDTHRLSVLCNGLCENLQIALTSASRTARFPVVCSPAAIHWRWTPLS